MGRLFPARATVSVEYAAAVGQRNAALRRLAANASSREALTPWTQAVLSLGEVLVEARYRTVDLLRPVFASRAERLGLSGATLTYDGEAPTAAELERRLERDLERGLTGAGPHLHDLRLLAGDRDLRNFGSQGEQRVGILALVLAEAEILQQRTGVAPLVLLDDVLSELDDERRRALAEMVASSGQTVLTATSAAALPAEPSQLLAVSPGEIREG